MSGLFEHAILFYWVEGTILKLHELEADPKVPTVLRFQCHSFDEFVSPSIWQIRTRVLGRGTLDKDVCRRHARRGKFLDS